MKIVWYIFIVINLLNTFVLVNGKLNSIFEATNDPRLPEQCYGSDLSNSLKTGVNDVVIVRQSDGSLKSTRFQFQIRILCAVSHIFRI